MQGLGGRVRRSAMPRIALYAGSFDPATNEFIGFAKTIHWRMRDNFLPAFSEVASGFIDQHSAILIGHEEPRRDGVHADIWAVFLREMNR